MTDQQKPARQRLTEDQRIARHEQAIARIRERKKTKNRKADTREKIVIGGTVLARMRGDESFRAEIVAMLRTISKDTDREAVAEWLSPTSTPGQ